MKMMFYALAVVVLVVPKLLYAENPVNRNADEEYMLLLKHALETKPVLPETEGRSQKSETRNDVEMPQSIVPPDSVNPEDGTRATALPKNGLTRPVVVSSAPLVSLTSYGRRLGDILLEMGSGTGYTVIFGAQVDPNLPVVVDVRGIPLSQALDAITGYVNYGYEIKDKTITVQKLIVRNFSIPDVSITSPNMTAEMGGDMVGGSNSGSSTGGGTGYGSSGADTGSQNLKANVTLKKAGDTVDGRKMFEENIKKLLSADGHYVVDWLAASLMVVDSPRNIVLISQYINGLKESSDRLLVVEATISEVTTNEDLQFGIDWNVLINKIGGTRISKPGGDQLTVATAVTNVISPTLTVTRTASDISGVLKALQDQGKVEVLSKPYIFARNLQPVAIFSGKSIPYIGSIQTTVSGTVGTSQTNYSIARAQDGIMLAVRCHIRDDGRIDVQIAPILATIDSYVTFNVGGNTFTNPVSSVQQTLQSVTLKDGETIVIGGIRRQQREFSTSGVPLLSKIPLLGNLFKSDNDTRSNSEIVIALKVKRSN